jgi:exopolysaccharide production protein ExoZ
LWHALLGKWQGEGDKMADVTDQSIPQALRSASFIAAEAPAATSSALVRNARLQYLRGFAAIAVLVYHAAHYVEKIQGGKQLATIFGDFWGAYGVAIFFVLSGYLMAQLSLRDDPRRFLLNRILRIYPMMLVVVAIAIAGYFVTGFGRRPDLLALTLIPAGPRDYYLGVEWTLLFEMTYYVIIAAMTLIGLRAWLEWVFGVWLVAIVVMAVTGTAPFMTSTPTISQLFGQSANCAFLLGFLLPRVIEKRWMPSPTVLCLLAVPVAMIGFYTVDGAVVRWPSGLSALFLVAAALKAAPVTNLGLAHRVGLRLGDASYSIYLCHMPLIVITGNLVSKTSPGLALWLGWTGGAIAIALALGPLDLRLHARLKRWADTLSARTVARVALGGIATFVCVSLVMDVDERITRREAETARAAYIHNSAQAWPSVIAGLDSSMPLDDGRLVLRGYGIDASAPDEDSHVVVEQGGKMIGFDRMRRMRPKIAQEAARPDLKSYRFGFSLVTHERFSCANGPLSAKLILSDGRVAPIPSETLNGLCPAK